jgi:hypothetical protein
VEGEAGDLRALPTPATNKSATEATPERRRGDIHLFEATIMPTRLLKPVKRLHWQINSTPSSSINQQLVRHQVLRRMALKFGNRGS